jgi:hypothetical protein
MRRADAARQARDVTQAMELALQVQARDRNHPGARALVSGLLKEADSAAAGSRTAAVNANAASTPAFQRAEARLTEARTSSDPRKRLVASIEATSLFREAERSAPLPPPPSAPPSSAPPPASPPASTTPPPAVDPLIRVHALLDDAEAAVKRAALDEAEKRLVEIDTELKARSLSLSPADEARRTAVANGIRSGRAAATRRADLAGIRSLLNEYKDAYDRLDVDRLIAVAPALRSRRSQLDASFKAMSSQTLEITTGEPAIDGQRATVSFREVLTQVPRVAGRKLPPSTREGQFVLAKNASGAWMIEAINVR